MGINPKGRNWGPLVNWDDLGKFYAALAISWTALLFAGMGWLVHRRHLPYLKIRNIPLACAAVCTLHVYLLKIIFAYTVNGNFSCTAEFWIMSIYLPFGIALFQANLVQLVSISGRQRKILDRQSHSVQLESWKRQKGLKTVRARWMTMTELERSELLIAIGMVSQVIVTLAIYLASRKFHASWGIVDKGHVKAAICRKGWEWIPSTIWQLVWSWFYGPYILWRIRNVRDVHYWRIQTWICVISGLPGTPLWLAALYSTAFKRVNLFWVQPMWLAPGIMTMQFVTVFFPIFEAYRSKAHLRAIQRWEERKTAHSSAVTNSTGVDSKNAFVFSFARPYSSSTTLSSGRRKEMYTMAALEKALSTNASPLLHFAATKEFTAENIVFLLQVRDWRASWSPNVKDNGTFHTLGKRQLYNAAVEIYTSSIHTKTAEFPINLDSRCRKRLDAILGPAVDPTKRDHLGNNNNDVAPFENYPWNETDPSSTYYSAAPSIPRSQVLSTAIIELQPKASFDPSSESRYDNSHTDFEDLDRDRDGGYHGGLTSSSQEEIFPQALPPIPQTKDGDLDVPFDTLESTLPEHFGPDIFNEAEQSVKYMVLTNTWVRYLEYGAKRETASTISSV